MEKKLSRLFLFVSLSSLLCNCTFELCKSCNKKESVKEGKKFSKCCCRFIITRLLVFVFIFILLLRTAAVASSRAAPSFFLFSLSISLFFFVRLKQEQRHFLQKQQNFQSD
jgi:hypothetical protein